MEGFLYCNVEINEHNKAVIDKVSAFAEAESVQCFCIKEPLGIKKYTYSYDKAVVICIPKSKIIIVDCGGGGVPFEDFYEDFIGDVGSISDKYDYKKVLGRPREWRHDCFTKLGADEFLRTEDMRIFRCTDNLNERKSELLISLITGSINDIDRIGAELPTNVLEKIKKKIILYDTTQTEFINESCEKKVIRIQGLAGTGKTELLLRRMVELYTQDKESKIAFTCFNKVLAADIEKRIPEFFNFMKVEEQILWKERLFVMSSWGSNSYAYSGMYRFICGHYNIPFFPFGQYSFDTLCQRTLEALKNKENFKPVFDYMLVDECQDFPESFFDLCEKVTSKKIYLAGDIFQNIFDNEQANKAEPDFLLNKCYRTDPKTLMFAHSLSLGLMETPQLGWLDDDAWKASGYQFEKSGNSYIFSRQPIKRFEDLKDENVKSIELIVEDTENYIKTIIEIVKGIKKKYKSLSPSDIGIVFLENQNENYTLMDKLKYEIQNQLSLRVIKGYELKRKYEGAVFISNCNNIKGLEFPFMICVATSPLNKNLTRRNSLYMLLTRSFITSYLLLSDKNSVENISKYKKTLNEITSTEKMTFAEPSDEEKAQMKKYILSVTRANKTLEQILEEKIKERNVDPKLAEKALGMAKIALRESDYSNEDIEIIIDSILSALVAIK